MDNNYYFTAAVVALVLVYFLLLLPPVKSRFPTFVAAVQRVVTSVPWEIYALIVIAVSFETWWDPGETRIIRSLLFLAIVQWFLLVTLPRLARGLKWWRYHAIRYNMTVLYQFAMLILYTWLILYRGWAVIVRWIIVHLGPWA